MRKNNNLEVSDKINISVITHSLLEQNALNTHKKYICTETQCRDFSLEYSLENQSIEMKIEIKKTTVNMQRFLSTEAKNVRT